MDGQEHRAQQERNRPREHDAIPEIVGLAERGEANGQEQHETEKAGDGET
jgi:hypothetical protein